MPTVKDFSVEEKLSSIVKLQKIDSKLDNIQVLKGELPIEVSDLEDEIEGLHARPHRLDDLVLGEARQHGKERAVRLPAVVGVGDELGEVVVLDVTGGLAPVVDGLAPADEKLAHGDVVSVRRCRI